jgi:hypothetical protein
MFRPDNKDDQKKAYQYIYGRTQDYWQSTLYTTFTNRYETRRDAFYMRPNSKTPKWRSKLTFATYFLGIKMLEAQLGKSYSGSPFVTVQLQAGSMRSPETDEKLKLANFDINRDINTGRFLQKFDRQRWFMEICGIGVAREYFAANSQVKTLRSIQTDRLGMQNQHEEQQIIRTERTVSEIIHPLNFAQEPTVHELRDARWSAVRFLLKTVDLYKMKGNKNYNQDDVNKVLEKIEAGGTPQLPDSTNIDYYYDAYWDKNEKTNNSIICLEYAGDLNFKDNYFDPNLYHAFLLPQYQALIRCRKSPFGFKNHWKICPYPDAEAPYGIDPCAMLLPVWQFNNDFMNQYMDYVRASMRVMYETYDGNIIGGLDALINGQTFGFALLDSEEAFRNTANGAIRPVRKDQTGIPGFQDMVNYIDKYTAQVQPASNLKGLGESEQLNKTATGIGFQASREDAWVSLLRGPIDNGLQDGIHQKLENRINFSAEEQTGDIGGEQYRYFPFEIGGPDYEYEINRQPPDQLVGRIQQALQIAGPYFQTGVIKMPAMAQLLKKMFELSGVPGAADMVADPSMPPQIPGMPGAPAGGAPQPGNQAQMQEAAAAGQKPGTDIKGMESQLRAAGAAAAPNSSGMGAAVALA